MGGRDAVVRSVLSVLPDEHRPTVAQWATQEAAGIASGHLMRSLLLAWRRAAASGQARRLSGSSDQ